MTDIGLGELKAFVAVARALSFTRAADMTGISRPALSHAIRALEQRLGTRLLHRTTRSVGLTEAGSLLLQRLAPVLLDLDDILQGVGSRKGEPSGMLRVNTNEGGARWLLQQAVPIFLERYPRVTLDIVTEGRLVDIVAEGFDAGVRLREAVPQDMVAVPFGGEGRFLPVASTSYVAVHGAPVTPADLLTHRCIRQRLPSGKPYRWEFERDGEETAIDVPGSLTLDNSQLMVEAAGLGLGIAFVPELYARSMIDNGRLVAMLLDWCPSLPGLCLYYAQNRHVPAPLRAFIDVVREVDGDLAKPRT